MARGRVWISRVAGVFGVIVVVAVVAVGIVATRSSHVTGSSAPGSASSAPSAGQIRARLAANLRVLPASGATAVSPATPVVVHAGAGTVASVQLTSAQGAVAGRLVAANEWQATGELAYGTQYRIVATVAGASDARTTTTTTFTTVAPQSAFDAAVFPHSGLTLGVGQPVSFRFSRDIETPEARADMLRHLQVTESVPVPGGWHWFSNHEVHFRPKTFWPIGEHIGVQWNLKGATTGAGAWGQGSGEEHFAIGQSRVSYANLLTHTMNVTLNGRTIATYPISGGKPTDPTMNGVHLVLDRESVVEMNSATNGVPVDSPDGYDELVYSDVHISDTGEYVHAAPWSVNSQGHQNVSHGCINLSPGNAATFFDFSRVGDIVVVTGSARPPVPGDHGVMDWDAPWSQFTPQPMPIADLGRHHVER
ncbi:MAG TPA: Ig-like domain-containing protein [Acidimicrobiia bacterium]|nr:Ig-like domain-containing protein [Acidimicrobiia bacterium]